MFKPEKPKKSLDIKELTSGHIPTEPLGPPASAESEVSSEHHAPNAPDATQLAPKGNLAVMELKKGQKLEQPLGEPVPADK
jgi:hypothetical protein